ncbi:MAG: hypothetical protein PWR01_2951 [Clostridiales bacterium]|jgi:Mg-chelatase subunit ChlI|nr:hypothetical protein [Clostridiales bacterium]MDN5281878.1 hypothetical protein [Candidatus Ozemobacter sp.]
MKKFRVLAKAAFIVSFVGFFANAVMATELKGSVSVIRDNARQISGAILHVGNQEYSIVMDENGRSLAQMYEHKDLKVDCTVEGKNIKVDTWEEIKAPSSPEPQYNEPEPTEEPSEEPAEEPENDEEPSDENSDDEPSDEKPSDEGSDEEPEENSDAGDEEQTEDSYED